MSLTLSYVEIDFGDAVNETPEEREARLIAEAEAEARSAAKREFNESLDDKVDPGANSIWRIVLGGRTGLGRRPKTTGLASLNDIPDGNVDSNN